jgi:hypothetical protein
MTNRSIDRENGRRHLVAGRHQHSNIGGIADRAARRGSRLGEGTPDKVQGEAHGSAVKSALTAGDADGEAPPARSNGICAFPILHPAAHATVMGKLLGAGEVFIQEHETLLRIELKPVLFAVAMLLAHAARKRPVKSSGPDCAAEARAPFDSIQSPVGFINRETLEHQMARLDPDWANTSINRDVYKLRALIADEAERAHLPNATQYAAEILETAWPGRRWSAGRITLTLLDGEVIPDDL